jgi:Glu-tRNA(Gln) amidotransferase subunit E-like FAD-binding protein
MGETREADDFISGFENLSKDEQKEIIKKLMPKFCEIAMKDKTVIQEMMPECLEMMKGADFPMKEMMSKMMGKT